LRRRINMEKACPEICQWTSAQCGRVSYQLGYKSTKFMETTHRIILEVFGNTNDARQGIDTYLFPFLLTQARRVHGRSVGEQGGCYFWCTIRSCKRVSIVTSDFVQ
jgi:hypothetical protein